MRLRVGVIGLGEYWLNRHRPTLMMMRDRYQVQAVYAPVAHLALQAARDFEAVAVQGYRALIRRKDVDAVLVLDSGWHDWLPLVAACEHEKAVYWASPLDIDDRDSKQLRELIDRAGIAFMAEFPRRFAPATLRLKELIATKLGRPQLVFCHRRLGKPQVQSNQKDSQFNREMIEMIDWCRYIVDESPLDLMSTCAQIGSQDIYRQISLRFGNAAAPITAEIACGQMVPEDWEEAISVRPNADMQIHCEHGLAYVDLPSKLVWFDDAGRHLESLDSELPVGQQLLTQFHRSVTSLVRKMASLEDAYLALQILRHSQRSGQEGRRLSLAGGFGAPPT